MGGVQIKNSTAVPLKIQLCQAGVLYHGFVKPGEFFTRETGAVHFTIRATVSEKDDTNWKDTVLPVFGVVLGSLVAMATAGAGLIYAVGVGAVVTSVAGITAGTAAAVEGLITGAVAMTSTGLLAAGGVVMTKELAEKLFKEAKESHCYISSPGWYFGGKNELEIHGGPQILAYSEGFKYNGSPLYIVDKNNSNRHS